MPIKVGFSAIDEPVSSNYAFGELLTARELGISLYRSIAGRRGIVLPAQRLGKYKAFTQYISVGFVLLPWTADAVGFQNVVVAVALVLTVVSGLQILRHGYVDWQRQDS